MAKYFFIDGEGIFSLLWINKCIYIYTYLYIHTDMSVYIYNAYILISVYI